jgi:hypothetical protein
LYTSPNPSSLGQPVSEDHIVVIATIHLLKKRLHNGWEKERYEEGLFGISFQPSILYKKVTLCYNNILKRTTNIPGDIFVNWH